MFGEHSLKRMFKQEIPQEDVLEVVRSGEIIREYPDDKPYPSSLMLKFVRKRPIHIVVNDLVKGVCFIVTAYEPDPTKWSKDFKTKLYE
jgi:hypothetical protein